MDWKKYWLHFPLAILTLATIVVISNTHDFLAKLVKRLAPESQAGGE